MCQERRTVYSICAHFKDTKRCKNLHSRKSRECERKFADLEICLGWCPPCYHYIANAHKRGMHKRKIHPKDPFIIKNYWAFKSWYMCDRFMDMDEVPMAMLDTREPYTYRRTDRPVKHPPWEEDMIKMPPHHRNGRYYEFHLIEPMLLESDGTFNFEKATLCYACRMFGPNQTFCLYVNRDFRAERSCQVHDLIEKAWLGTLTYYAREDLGRKRAPELTRYYQDTRRQNTFIGDTVPSGVRDPAKRLWNRQKDLGAPNVSRMQSSRLPSDSDGEFSTEFPGSPRFLARGRRTNPVRRRPSEWAKQLILRALGREPRRSSVKDDSSSSWKGAVMTALEKFMEQMVTDDGADKQTGRQSPKGPAANPVRLRQDIEEVLEKDDLLCEEHGKKWISECEDCRGSRVSFWLLQTWASGAGDPDGPPSPSPVGHYQTREA